MPGSLTPAILLRFSCRSPRLVVNIFRLSACEEWCWVDNSLSILYCIVVRVRDVVPARRQRGFGMQDDGHGNRTMADSPQGVQASLRPVKGATMSRSSAWSLRLADKKTDCGLPQHLPIMRRRTSQGATAECVWWAVRVQSSSRTSRHARSGHLARPASEIQTGISQVQR